MASAKKPCEFCDPKLEGIYEGFDVDGLSYSFEKYPDNLFMGISIIGCDQDGKDVDYKFEIEMNYCPVCGRKLDA